MAKIYLPGADGVCCVIGLSTDAKPTSGTSNGFSFIEVDTGNIYLCDGQAWSAVPSGEYEPANANIQGHIASAHAPSNAQANADITKAEIEAKLTGVISSHSHAGGSTVGYVLNPFAGNAATLTDGQTIYFGGTPAVAPSTTGGNHRLYVPKSGAIKAAYIYAHSATAGTGESWPLYIRLNNTTDTLIQALLVANAQRVWVNTSLNIAVSQGDYIEIKSVNPTWATNPANVRFGGSIYIDR